MATVENKQSGHVIHPCVIELREMLQSVLGDNFVKLYHYGSRVEGGAQPDSDYDVLCVTRRPLSRLEMNEVMDRRIDLQLADDVFFDLHFRHEEQIESRSPLYSPYIDQVVSKGIVV